MGTVAIISMLVFLALITLLALGLLFLVKVLREHSSKNTPNNQS